MLVKLSSFEAFPRHVGLLLSCTVAGYDKTHYGRGTVEVLEDGGVGAWKDTAKLWRDMPHAEPLHILHSCWVQCPQVVAIHHQQFGSQQNL